MDPDQTIWIANSGNGYILPNVTHYDLNGHQLSKPLSFQSSIFNPFNPIQSTKSIQIITISDLLWLQKNILYYDQGIVMTMPSLYTTAPMLCVNGQQPSEAEKSLNDFMNGPNGYLGVDVNVSDLIGWCVNNPSINVNITMNNYLIEAHNINTQLLLDLHNDSLILDYATALTNAQSSILSTQIYETNLLSPMISNHQSLTLNPSLPIGLVYNLTDGFVKTFTGLQTQIFPIPITIDVNNDASYLIAADSQGKIYTYNPLTNNEFWMIIDESDDHSSYTGVTIADNKLYLADLANLRVRVYDYQWNNVRQLDENGFEDPHLPAYYSPFNICFINGSIYVLYAKLKTDVTISLDIETGPGLGIINIFTPQGTLIKRATSHGSLNAPWGLTFHDDHFYVANHGDGQIHVYDQNWQYLSHLQFPDHDPSIIPTNNRHSIIGLFGLISVRHNLYFVSQSTGNHGLLGRLSPK